MLLNIAEIKLKEKFTGQKGCYMFIQAILAGGAKII
jgi:hypothetical protein